MTKRKKNQVLEDQYRQQGSCCMYCKEPIPFEYITRDHIDPVSKGNTLVKNKVFCCRQCNNHKGDRSYQEFKDLMLVKALRVLRLVADRNFKMSEEELTQFRYYYSVYKNVSEIVSNGGLPPIVFT